MKVVPIVAFVHPGVDHADFDGAAAKAGSGGHACKPFARSRMRLRRDVLELCPLFNDCGSVFGELDLDIVRPPGSTNLKEAIRAFDSSNYGRREGRNQLIVRR